MTMGLNNTSFLSKNQPQNGVYFLQLLGCMVDDMSFMSAQD